MYRMAPELSQHKYLYTLNSWSLLHCEIYTDKVIIGTWFASLEYDVCMPHIIIYAD